MHQNTVSFETPGNLGDWLCMLSAAREYAKRHPDERVYITNLFDVASSYRDGLVEGGRCDHNVIVNAVHREKNYSSRHNYLGTFLREICPEISEPMTLDLPRLEKRDDAPVAVIQPFSCYAENPPTPYIQRLVDTFVDITGHKLYAVGNTNTKQDLRNVDYSLLQESAVELLRNVAAARFVLTPRSASAHIAAGYGIPAFVWMPDDGENWHLDYPDWKSARVLHTDGCDTAVDGLANALSAIEWNSPTGHSVPDTGHPPHSAQLPELFGDVADHRHG